MFSPFPERIYAQGMGSLFQGEKIKMKQYIMETTCNETSRRKPTIVKLSSHLVFVKLLSNFGFLVYFFVGDVHLKKGGKMKLNFTCKVVDSSGYAKF